MLKQKYRPKHYQISCIKELIAHFLTYWCKQRLIFPGVTCKHFQSYNMLILQSALRLQGLYWETGNQLTTLPPTTSGLKLFASYLLSLTVFLLGGPAESSAWSLCAPLSSVPSVVPWQVQVGQEEIWQFSPSTLPSRPGLKPLCAEPNRGGSHTRQCFILMNWHFSLGLGSTSRFPARFNQGGLKAIQNRGQERI